MVDPFRGLLPQVYGLIEGGQYFILHAPRQTGKTTFLHQLAHRLNKEGKYISLVFSVETAGVPSFTEEMANERMVDALWRMLSIFLPKEEWPAPPVHPIALSNYVAQWAQSQSKPIVLLIDEVDSLWDDVLVSFLRQLRDGFQARPKNFPQSIALVGLRDIREYRMRARGENPALGSGSPFNIKAESITIPIFSKTEVRGLLDQHTQDTGQVFSNEVFETLYQYSGGQPWLTNALANEIVRNMLEEDHTQAITVEMVEKAKEILITKRQTHLDSLVDKMKEPRVRQVVMSIINGEELTFDDYNDAILYCRDLGIVKQGNPITFANPIYREIITRILNSAFQDSFNQDLVDTTWYLKPDGNLDMDKLLKAFVEFYRRNSESWLERFQYKEAGHQLLLMAFLQRVVNGGGRIDREMAAGNGRTDLTVQWKKELFVFELKVRWNSYAESDGLQQLSRYLDKLGQKSGYLVIFETKTSEELPWEQRLRWETQTYAGKEITLICM